MIHLGLCDTDTTFLDKMAAALHRLFDPCRIEYMYGPSALEVFLQSGGGNVDVLITEIELRGRNAIEIISENLQESCPLQIVYMTAKMEYCTQVYDTRHCGLIIKPVQTSLLEKQVKRGLEALENKKRTGIVLRKNGSVHIISSPSLIYAEGHGRMIRVVTDAESLESYEKLTDFSYHLDGRFIQCHKSYLINMERVKKFQGDSFVMDNGEVIPISQSRRKQTREEFLNYIGNGAL